MREKLFPKFAIISAAILTCAAPALAQGNVQGTPTACGDGKGHWYPINSCQCRGTCGSSRGSGGYSGPSAEEIEAERARQAERARETQRKQLEEMQRQAELERQQQAEEERARQEWLRTVNEAANNLKGASHNETGLKGTGDGNNAFFGLKGVSSDEGSASINTARPESSSREISTAAKQLTCASDITNYALKHVSNIVRGAGSRADLDEIKYLAREATNALQGNKVGVECNSSGALKFTKTPDLKAITPMYKAALDNLVRDSQSLYETQQKAATAQQKLDEAKKRVEELKKQSAAQSSQPAVSQKSPKPAQSTGDSAIDKAYAEQKAWHQKDQEKIKQINDKQNELQQQQLDALALLRKAQAELNAINSQKVNETKAATSDAKEIGALQSGKVPQQSR